ncbi:MAG: LysE family translocator [Lentimicrobiaceae bacterium]|jgi:threonine/homoserine/homoserine lactone efflux protein|nr:LysE family translocator [Lentimicrobiaceae bacterium]
MTQYPLFEGIVIGLTLSVLLGPALFSLLQTSIRRGFKQGIVLAVGVFLSDALLVSLCYLGALQLLGDNTANNLFFGLVGGLILIGFGIYTFTRKMVIDEENNSIIETKQPRFYTYLLKGFFLNFTNPFIWIFWIGLMGLVKANYSSNQNHILEFFTGTLLTVFATDILKCLIAHKIRQKLKPKLLVIINHLVGALLVLFGLILIVRVLLSF